MATPTVYTYMNRESAEKSKRSWMGTICRLNNLRLSENRFLKRGNVDLYIYNIRVEVECGFLVQFIIHEH